MARYIHCDRCNLKMAETAKKFGELYESIQGVAKKKMNCDGCFLEINIGDNCHAALLLDNEYHPNYEIQHPNQWASDYIT